MVVGGERGEAVIVSRAADAGKGAAPGEFPGSICCNLSVGVRFFQVESIGG